jgi:hypothetical protein
MDTPTRETLMRVVSPAGMEATFEAAVRQYCNGLGELRSAVGAMGRAFVLAYPPEAELERIRAHGGRGDAETERAVRRVLKLWAWRALAQMTNMTRLMTAADNRRLEDQLRNPDSLPEVTAANTTAWADTLVERLPALSRDAIAEAWRILCPPQSRYKTNRRNEGIGRKMILTWWFVQYQGVGTLYEGSSFSEQAQAVDKAFHLLDGKGLPKYPGDFLTAIREAMRNSRRSGFAGESEYFRFKVYGNGNVHLELKRMDLVDEINRQCGGNMVPQAASA